jgi:hypothetical protein
MLEKEKLHEISSRNLRESGTAHIMKNVLSIDSMKSNSAIGHLKVCLTNCEMEIILILTAPGPVLA